MTIDVEAFGVLREIVGDRSDAEEESNVVFAIVFRREFLSIPSAIWRLRDAMSRAQELMLNLKGVGEEGEEREEVEDDDDEDDDEDGEAKGEEGEEREERGGEIVVSDRESKRI